MVPLRCMDRRVKPGGDELKAVSSGVKLADFPSTYLRRRDMGRTKFEGRRFFHPGNNQSSNEHSRDARQKKRAPASADVPAAPFCRDLQHQSIDAVGHGEMARRAHQQMRARAFFVERRVDVHCSIDWSPDGKIGASRIRSPHITSPTASRRKVRQFYAGTHRLQLSPPGLSPRSMQRSGTMVAGSSSAMTH